MPASRCRQSPLYEHILFEELGISRRFFKSKNRLKVIRKKLAAAASAMRGELGEQYGMNTCLHTASAAVFEGRNQDRFTRTLSQVEERFPGIDPQMVVTAASLYYLIKSVGARNDLSRDEDASVRHLRRRFKEICWFVGAARARELGFE